MLRVTCSLISVSLSELADSLWDIMYLYRQHAKGKLWFGTVHLNLVCPHYRTPGLSKAAWCKERGPRCESSAQIKHHVVAAWPTTVQHCDAIRARRHLHVSSSRNEEKQRYLILEFLIHFKSLTVYLIATSEFVFDVTFWECNLCNSKGRHKSATFFFSRKCHVTWEWITTKSCRRRRCCCRLCSVSQHNMPFNSPEPPRKEKSTMICGMLIKESKHIVSDRELERQIKQSDEEKELWSLYWGINV